MAGATIQCQMRGGGAQHPGRDRRQPDVARRTVRSRGVRRARPGLDQALAAVRPGDTLVVPKLDRLVRSVPDARHIGDSLVAAASSSLAPSLAPRNLVSGANVRKPGPDAIADRVFNHRPHLEEREAAEADGRQVC
jgi:hypothetical protein